MLIHLEVSSWVGQDPKAVHYYGTLKSDDQSIELKRKVKKSDLKNLNNESDIILTYRLGSLTNKFNTKEEVIKLAKKTYKEHFKEATVLCLGNDHHREPKKILDAAKGIKGKANTLFRAAEKLGFYDNPKNDEVMDTLTHKWETVIGL